MKKMNCIKNNSLMYAEKNLVLVIKFKKYCKVRDHCHCTIKDRDAVHIISVT